MFVKNDQSHLGDEYLSTKKIDIDVQDCNSRRISYKILTITFKLRHKLA